MKGENFFVVLFGGVGQLLRHVVLPHSFHNLIFTVRVASEGEGRGLGTRTSLFRKISSIFRENFLTFEF